MLENTPQVGDWYQGINGIFEVVAVDDDDHTIEIQYYDGTVDDLESELWEEMAPLVVAPPEDAYGAFDDLELQMLDEAADNAAAQEYRNPLDALM